MSTDQSTALNVLAMVDEIEQLALEHCDEEGDENYTPLDMRIILKRCRKIKELLK